jgi:iron complex transport system substrate-binding protein
MARLTLLAAALAAVLVTISAPAPAAAADPKPLFPVTVRAANGAVTIPKRPRRIVSLSATATEALFAIGAGRQVVAVDALSNFPRRAPRTSLSGYRPNVEAIMGYRPDLVVTRSDGGLSKRLSEFGVPVIVNPEAPNLRDAYRQIRQLGLATGHPRRAAALAASVRARIAGVVRAVGPRGRGATVYHELTTDYYAASSRTFIGQIYRLFGLGNIADAAAATGGVYPQLSGEHILAADPDFIFLADSKCCGQNLRTVAERPGWANLTAVRRRLVIALDDDIASRWGPRVVLLVQRIGRVIRTARR